MSALLKTSGETATGCWYEFEQPVGIPTYLISLAVGDFRGVEVGPRSTIWAEGKMADIGAKEFCDMEKFVSTAESLVNS
jgi:leukotriene-A4 hydrolase